MNKKDLIKLVEEIGKNVGANKSNLFYDNKSKIGNNQFREIAGVCRTAECIEEIKLLIQYNISKAAENKSWAYKIGDGSFGDLVIKKINYIEQNSEGNNIKEILNDFSLFFGYLYWQARIWEVECKASNSNYNKNNNYNYNKSNNGGKR